MGKRPMLAAEVNGENTSDEPKAKKLKKANISQNNVTKKEVKKVSEIKAGTENTETLKKMKKKKKKLPNTNTLKSVCETNGTNIVEKAVENGGSLQEDKTETKPLQKQEKSKKEKSGPKNVALEDETDVLNVVNGQVKKKKGKLQKKNQLNEGTIQDKNVALTLNGQTKKKNKNKMKVDKQSDITEEETITVEKTAEEIKLDTESNELLYSLLGKKHKKIATLDAFQKKLIKLSLVPADEMDTDIPESTYHCLEKTKQNYQRVFSEALERGRVKGSINFIDVNAAPNSKTIKFEDSD